MAQATVLRRELSSPFATIPEDILLRENLSWRAKGLLTYLLNRPDDWQFYKNDLINRSTEGKTALETALGELRRAGFLSITDQRDQAGMFSGTVWIIRDDPSAEAKSTGTGLSGAGKSDVTNKESSVNKNMFPSDNAPAREGQDERSRNDQSNDDERSSRSRAVKLPNDWEPNDSHAEVADEEGVDLERQAIQFRDHARANGRTQRDWDASFRNWLRKAADYGAGRSKGSENYKPTQPTLSLERVAEKYGVNPYADE